MTHIVNLGHASHFNGIAKEKVGNIGILVLWTVCKKKNSTVSNFWWVMRTFAISWKRYMFYVQEGYYTLRTDIA